MTRLPLSVLLLLCCIGCGGGGGGGGAAPAVPNLAPTASAGADQTSAENTLITLSAAGSTDTDGTITAYAWTQTAGAPMVTIAGANQAAASFTVTGITADIMLTFQLQVTDNGGSTATDTVVVTVTNQPNQGPVANAGPDQTVAENSAVTLTAAASADPDGTIATYLWTQTAGTPMVAITNPTQATATLTAPAVMANTTLTFQVTVTDNEGGMAMDTVVVTVTDLTGLMVTISGAVTYDHVPHNPNTNGLNYAAITQDPVRAATVIVRDATNNQIATTTTDDNGNYSAAVPAGMMVRIQVVAESIRVGTPSWAMSVIDNTNGGAVYVLSGALADSGIANSTRNLNAPSGWDNAAMAYTGTRASGPFAILASAYEGIRATVAVDPNVAFPTLTMNWSVNNTTAMCPGGIPMGCIETSFYDPGTVALYFVGRADNDTDEFDGHIVIHEWGHYFVDRLSRSDSIGGAHGAGDRLDPRVAFDEGFATAMAGIITGDPVYRDSAGMNQSMGGEIDNEENNNEGWFSESTVQSLVYDLADNTADSPTDTLAIGWGPIYNTMTDPLYRTTASRTTVFTFLSRLRTNNPASAGAMTALATSLNVNGTDAFGSGETFLPPGTMNVGDITPVYTVVEPNGVAVEVCSINEFGTMNSLSNIRFLRLEIAVMGNYRFQATSPAGDPTVQVFTGATTQLVLDTPGAEDMAVPLAAGTYVLEVSDTCNVTPGMGGCPAAGNARTCISITVTQM